MAARVREKLRVRSRFLLIFAAGVMAVLPAAASAQWTAKAGAGAVASRGNTDTDSANLKFDVTRAFVKWRHSVGFTGVYASESAGTTGQRWEGRAQSDYEFHSKGFWFGSARYEEDRFSGFEYQAMLGSGLGWRFLDDETTKLNIQVGAGYKTFEPRSASVAQEQDGRNDNLIGHGTVNFDRALTETTKLVHKLLVESGRDNTFTQADLSVEVKILNALALAVGYSVRHNSNPPEGFLKTDTLTTLNLVYELK